MIRGIVSAALAMGLVAGAGAPAQAETLKAWNMTDAIHQCGTLPDSMAGDCVIAAIRTDWNG